VTAFVFRLLPPRPSFPTDMTEAERATMLEHVDYWTALAHQGRALAFGPVADPRGAYGLGIVVADSLAEAEALRDGDPAVRSPHGFSTEMVPMVRLVTPDAVYEMTG
jgi:uncharacterized protein YciI